MKKFLAAAVTTLAVLIGMALPASAHAATIVATQNCQGAHLQVTLVNVTQDRLVHLTSTVPGATASWQKHFNSSVTNAFTADVPSDGSLAGAIHVWITHLGAVEFDQTVQLAAATGCVPPPVDICKNLEGVQESIPPGLIIENGNDTGDCVPQTCANDHDNCGEVTLIPTCSGWTIQWVNFYDPTERDLTTSNGAVSRVTHTETPDGNDAVAAPVEGKQHVVVTANWVDSGQAPRSETAEADFDCPVTPPTTDPPTTPTTQPTPPTTQPTEISTAATAQQPTLPGNELAYTGDMTAVLAGLGAALVLTGLLLKGIFRSGPFANSKVLFGKL